jgi:hypothetical protein
LPPHEKKAGNNWFSAPLADAEMLGYNYDEDCKMNNESFVKERRVETQ